MAASDSTTSPSTRFTPLSTHHLANQPTSSVTTLPSLIETSERLAAEAREALPYSFDECTYNKGYLKQNIWSCLDCGERGVCYGCSISCHAEHKLVELWTRRHFQCDCPTTAIPNSEGTKRRRCTLNPPEKQPQLPNQENRYSRNFAGKFCRCGREYDAETETEAMLNCIGCEDWFHETCLNLRPPAEPIATDKPPHSEVKTEAKPEEQGEEEEDDEDEEKEVLIRSDTYDALICATCVQSSDYLQGKAGSEGWMIIEPIDGKGFEVIGRKMEGDLPKLETHIADSKQELVEQKITDPTAEALEPLSNGKRANDHASDERESKKPRHEFRTIKGKGDIFLAQGVRAQLKETLSFEVAASLPFPLEDEETYEPPQDEDDPDETLDEITSRVVGSLPRVQAIEALHGFQTMKEKLMTMLATHAQDGTAVSKEDVDGFFEQLKASRSK